MLRIAAAADRRSGRPIPVIALTDLTVGGVRQVSVVPFTRATGATNVAVRGDTLRCVIACAFGIEEGVYRFTATAEGYRSTRIEQFAHYQHVSPGCPSTSWGSTSITVSLEPAP